MSGAWTHKNAIAGGAALGLAAAGAWAPLSREGDREAWITRDRDALEKLAHRLNPPGSPYDIDIWGWGWPIPSRVDEFAEHTREILNSPLLTGYCLDIEAKSWSTRDHGQASMDERARALIAELRKGARKPLILSAPSSPRS